MFVSCVLQLSNSESTQQQMSFLNKQLLLLGEAHKLSMQELHHTGADNTKVRWKEVCARVCVCETDADNCRDDVLR